MTDFLTAAARIIIHTPIWVWPLYALLLFLGFQRTRDSIVPLWRVLILPAVVTLLTILNFIGAGVDVLPAALMGLIIGGGLGWWLEPDRGTRRLPGGKMWLRSEWWTFAQIALVLVFRYAINVLPVLYPPLYADLSWRLSTLFVAAALSALFLGRTAARLRIYFFARRQPVSAATTMNGIETEPSTHSS